MGCPCGTTDDGFRYRSTHPTAPRSILAKDSSPLPENLLQPLRRDRQPRDGAGYGDSVLKRIGDRRTARGYAALAGALDAERVEVGREILGEDDFHTGDLPGGRHQIIRKRHR